MTILVTGGAGYIGSHTVKALLRAGHTVYVFDSLENGHLSSVQVDDAYFIQGDLLNRHDLDRAFMNHAIDAVIHFAAYIDVGESVKDPAKFFSNNTAGTLQLLHAMQKYQIRHLVFSSTAAVYGEPKVIPILEDSPKQPTNPYGTSKLLVEQAITDLTRFTNFHATILRYFNACGADSDGDLGEDHGPETHLIPLILLVALGKRENVSIFGSDYHTSDGTAIRDYIHVDDLAQAHILALEKQIEQGTKLAIYNVGTGRGYSVQEVLEACRTITGHPIPAQVVARRPGDPAQLVADATRIQQELGWHSQHSELEHIVRSAWNWFKAHPNGYTERPDA